MPRKNPKNEKSELVGEIVSIYRRAGSKKWYAYWRDGGRPHRKSLGTAYVGKARKLALELEAKLQAGEEIQPPKVPLLAEAIDEYLASLRGKQRSAKTIEKYRHCFKMALQLAADLDVTRLSQINHRFIDEYCNRCVEQGAKPKTVKNDVVTVRQLVNFGLRRGLLVDDPLKNLELPKAPLTPQPCWTAAQVERILAAALPRYRGYFTLLWSTGARASEAAWLTWDDVDYDKGIIHIRAKPGWQPKTGDQRVIPLNDLLRATLVAQPTLWPWVFTSRSTAKRPQAGRQIDIRRALAHLKTVVKRLDLPEGHLHTFRHSFISHALNCGVPESVVRSWVGHVDARIMRIYTHVADQISQQAMKELFGQGDDEPHEDRRTSA